MRCLQKEPGDRFADMTELGAALTSAGQGVDAVAEGELENASYRRCGRCEIDNSRFATECSRCGSDLNTRAQRAYMLRHMTAVRMTERSTRAHSTTVASPGVVVARAATPPPRGETVLEPPVALPRDSPGEFVIRVLAAVPVGIWKRVLGYVALVVLLDYLFFRWSWGLFGVSLATMAVSVAGLWAHSRD